MSDSNALSKPKLSRNMRYLILYQKCAKAILDSEININHYNCAQERSSRYIYYTTKLFRIFYTLLCKCLFETFTNLINNYFPYISSLLIQLYIKQQRNYSISKRQALPSRVLDQFEAFYKSNYTFEINKAKIKKSLLLTLSSSNRRRIFRHRISYLLLFL